MFTVKLIKESTGSIDLYEYNFVRVEESGIEPCIVGEGGGQDGIIYHYISNDTAHYQAAFVTDSNGHTVYAIKAPREGRKLD